MTAPLDIETTLDLTSDEGRRCRARDYANP